MYDKKLIKELLIANPTLNNVEICRLYNQKTGTNSNPESFRKIAAKVRKKHNIGNVAFKHTSKAFFTEPSVTGTTTSKSFDKESSTYKFTKVNNEKGTLESEVVVSFEPRNDEELAELHKVDLTKYKISNYWTKLQPNGDFTSSLLCSLRKVGDSISLDEIKDVITDATKEVKFNYVPKLTSSSNNGKALMLWFADEHVGASVSGSIYENKYDQNEYFKRKSKALEIALEQSRLHGKFDKIIVSSLGDNLDGFNGKTTRSLTGPTTHTLEQNMTNAQAVKTYVDVNKAIYNSLVDLDLTNTFELYNVNNSNHAGLGFDALGNLALSEYLKAKFGEDLFKITDFDKIIDKFTYGDLHFYLAHGKDEIHMKKNMPVNLNPTIENYIKEYIDEYTGSKINTQNVFVKGDLHQFATQQGRWFSYQNCPSLFGSSAWVHANIGKGNAGFCYSVVDKKDTSVAFNPVWVK